MCLLTVMSPNATPTREQLIRAAKSNPHGFGYAIMFEDRIVTGRGMDAEEIIDRFLDIRHRCPDTWAMFHHRYTTHGTTTKGNCHPFRVGGQEDIVLGHNGVIPISMDASDKRSDTRVFAEEYLPELLDMLDDSDGFEMLEEYIGYSKVAIFSLSDRLSQNVYILNQNMGHWHNGIWWSNDSYKESKWESFQYGYKGSMWSNYGNPYDDDDITTTVTRHDSRLSEWWKNGGVQQCMWCYANSSDEEWNIGYCGECMTCFECANDLEDCDCGDARLYNVMRSRKNWWEEVEEGVVIG